MSLPVKKATPLSLRLSIEERNSLEARAGQLPISTYVKQQLFGDDRRAATQFRRVTADKMLLAQLLAVLGQSRIAPNLKRLAQEASTGGLYPDETTVAQLREACDDVRLMHNALMRALGLQEKERSAHEIRATEEFNRVAQPDEDQ